ncbi:hypothetical protein DPMN_147532 [Dreissena polymorpha]|uniref:Uncharacterized protein n=1 Tax=Dreissena polymorpha TaxID=45954 RepID=A0A9D4F8H0_DREPO|nr:hypothetical protein DPMN_147532 [Dreissena polymorpha]
MVSLLFERLEAVNKLQKEREQSTRFKSERDQVTDELRQVKSREITLNQDQQTDKAAMHNSVRETEREKEELRMKLFITGVRRRGDKIFVTNNTDDKVLTLARDDTLLHTFTDPDLQDPEGIHVTDLGQVLVCGFDSKTILHLDGEGKKKLATLARMSDGLDRPWKSAPPPGGLVFQQTRTIFDLIQYVIDTYVLTTFHEDRTKNFASRVLTRFYYSHMQKNTLPNGGYVFQPTGTIFALVQDIIGTNLLTKFHEDWTIMWPLEKNAPPPGRPCFSSIHRKINVASTVLTRHDGGRTKGDHKSSP